MQLTASIATASVATAKVATASVATMPATVWAGAAASHPRGSSETRDFDRFKHHGSALRVLVVDDDEPLRQSIAEALTEEGFDVHTSADGRGAMELLRLSRFDLVILDLRMPGMNGWEFRSLQRQHPALSMVPVLAITADRSPKARAVHADGLLHKPFGSDDLLNSVARVLEETERRGFAHRLAEAERLAVLGRLAASVGHEINNPLTGVAFNVRSLSDAVHRAAPAALVAAFGHAEAPQMLKEALEGVDRIEAVVRDLRTLSQRPEDLTTKVDIEALLDKALDLVRRELYHRAEVVRSYTGVGTISGQVGKLTQLFVNLLVNAAEALPSGQASQGRVTLSTSAEEQGILVQVKDSGEGIAHELLPYLFEPFFSTRKAQGTGLGLAICREIVVAHGGTIQIDSAPSEGTLVSVHLPRSQPVPSEPPGWTSATRLRVRPSAKSQQRGRVLVIDDDSLVLRTVRRVLGASHEVVTVSRMREGLRLIEEGADRFDVILCDLIMPDGGGRELYEALLQSAPDQIGRLLFMTGGIEGAGFAEAIALANARVLLKPFEIDELVTAVDDVIGAQSQH